MTIDQYPGNRNTGEDEYTSFDRAMFMFGRADDMEHQTGIDYLVDDPKNHLQWVALQYRTNDEGLLEIALCRSTRKQFMDSPSYGMYAQHYAPNGQLVRSHYHVSEADGPTLIVGDTRIVASPNQIIKNPVFDPAKPNLDAILPHCEPLPVVASQIFNT